jgi:hypothetical protein
VPVGIGWPFLYRGVLAVGAPLVIFSSLATIRARLLDCSRAQGPGLGRLPRAIQSKEGRWNGSFSPSAASTSWTSSGNRPHTGLNRRGFSREDRALCDLRDVDPDDERCQSGASFSTTLVPQGM